MFATQQAATPCCKPAEARPVARRGPVPVLIALSFALLGWVLPCVAANAPDERHPLEVEALTRPNDVLRKLPAARQALLPGDHEGAARLALAEANACRVIADWRCQRRAGSIAIAEADSSTNVHLQVRGRIALGRALSRLGDFNNAGRTLAEAQRRLGSAPDDRLLADILLAYSSVSERLGKLDESYRYAKDGLAHASASENPEMRIRLLRNMAHIASARGRPKEARDLLQQAARLLPAIHDPKLTAEILLEEARSARELDDADTVELMAQRIGAIGDELQNTQLRGLSYETHAQALQLRGRFAEAFDFYQKARFEFESLKLKQDELRTLRAIVDLQLIGIKRDELPESITRLNQLGDEVSRTERESAAADFEERLRYAESDAALAHANTIAENARLRAQANEDKFHYTLAVSILALSTLGVVVALHLQQRKHARAMRQRGRELEFAISTDFLTSVHSRRFITDAGNHAVERAVHDGRGLAIAVVDIDHFKQINDSHGHAAGDEVLKAVAVAMRGVCRDSDIIARYGGEEFAVLLEGVDSDHALDAAERLRKAVAGVAVHSGGAVIAPTASVGVACLASEDRGFESLLMRADRALYRAKEDGRDRVVMADESAVTVPAAASVSASMPAS